jgi:hypothetical protein
MEQSMNFLKSKPWKHGNNSQYDSPFNNHFRGAKLFVSNICSVD